VLPRRASSYVAHDVRGDDPGGERYERERKRMKCERASEVASQHGEPGTREAAAGAWHMKERCDEAELQGRAQRYDGQRGRGSCRRGASRCRALGERAQRDQDDAPVGSQTSFMSLVKKYGSSRK
jgi:hypothetical protein